MRERDEIMKLDVMPKLLYLQRIQFGRSPSSGASSENLESAGAAHFQSSTDGKIDSLRDRDMNPDRRVRISCARFVVTQLDAKEVVKEIDMSFSC